MDVPESWEDVVDELEEPAPPPPPPKQKTSPSKAKPQATRAKFQEEEDFLADPVAERLRREKLVEESEKRLVDDFFAGCERPDVPSTANAAEDSPKPHVSARAAKTIAASTTDPVDAIQLKTYADCERFVEALSKKILDSPAKSPAWLRMLDLLLKECSPKMDLKDLKTLQGKLNSTVVAREKADRLLAEKKKKPNDLRVQCKKYEEELDIVYGGGSEDEEEDYDDDVPDDGADDFI